MFLLSSDTAAAGGIGIGFTLVYIVVIVVIMYFLAIRPQKKEQKKLNAMLAELAVGDSVVTTSGFYGVVIDITDEDVIVEFGSNKNCRIPMKKLQSLRLRNRKQNNFTEKGVGFSNVFFMHHCNFLLKNSEK